MATASNGWSVIPSTSGEVIRVGGRAFRVRAGDPARTFEAFIARYVAEVEPIADGPLDDWSWADRLVRDSDTAVSNHAAGGAVDLNALDHQRGVRHTFTPDQLRALRALLADFPVIRWGGDYRTVVDDMHFEITASLAELARFVRDRLPHVRRTTAPQEADTMNAEQAGQLRWLVEHLKETGPSNENGRGQYRTMDSGDGGALRELLERVEAKLDKLPVRLLDEQHVETVHPVTGAKAPITVRTALGRSANVVNDAATALTVATSALAKAVAKVLGR